MKRIVLTGGPGGGKSSTLAAIKTEFKDFVLIVPEAATMLLSSGFPVPGQDIAWSQEWQDSFERAILTLQKELEFSYELMAREKGVAVLIHDRGLLDGAAYTVGGQSVLCLMYNVCLQEALRRYETVIHLESLATGKPELYGKDNNEGRFEDKDRASQLEYATREAWQGHPNYYLITCQDSIEGKIERTIEIIRRAL